MRSNLPTRLCAAAGVCAIALGLAWFAGKARAQQVTGMEMKGFRVQLEQHPPPNQAQVRTLLEGGKAEPQSGGLVLLNQVRVSNFTTNGALEMQILSPQCVYDVMQRTVSSTGALQIQTADGRFALDGKGFLLRTNTSGPPPVGWHLTISNQVHTVIRNFSTRSRKS